MLTKFKLPDISMMLPQVAFTQNEVEYLLDKHNTNGKSQHIPKEAEKTIINLSLSEQQSIFEANEGYKNVQKWFLDKLTERNDAKCCACRSTMPKNTLYVYLSGMYIPPNQTFSKERKFCFCALPTCIKKKTYMSNIKVPPCRITTSEKSSQEDKDTIRSRGLPI